MLLYMCIFIKGMFGKASFNRPGGVTLFDGAERSRFENFYQNRFSCFSWMDGRQLSIALVYLPCLGRNRMVEDSKKLGSEDRFRGEDSRSSV